MYRPTLSGLGERAHLLDRMTVDLELHIDDICGLLRFEDLHNVVLVGHSYGGVVITGAADREAERLDQLVYLDALVPRDGEAVFDLAGHEVTTTFRDWIAREGGGTRLPSKLSGPEFYGVTDTADIAWMAPRLTDQPAATYEQRLKLSGPGFAGPRTYIRCTRSDKMPPDVAVRVQSDPGFRLIDLDAGHDVMITNPEALTALLIDLAERSTVREVP